MPFTLATWNINSVRLRADLVVKLLTEEAPDILCLQECKSPVDKIPAEVFAGAGYGHMVARGQKGYNGRRDPVETAAGGRGPPRFLRERRRPARWPRGLRMAPRSTISTSLRGAMSRTGRRTRKFGHKLDFLTEMRDWFRDSRPEKSILVGDLNIAPREDDVWSHKQLLKVVSHTPIEVEHMADTQEAGRWVDVTRADIPEGLLYSWWSYRAQRLGCGRQGAVGSITSGPRRTSPTAAHGSRILRAVRGWTQPSDHAPVFASFDL